MGAPDFFRNDMNVEPVEAPSEDGFRSSDMVQEGPNLIADPVEDEKSQEAVEKQPEAVQATPEKGDITPNEGVKEAQQKVDSAIKELAAIYGDKEFKLPAEAKFKHKVDGKEVDVQLQELLNHYSGKQSWDKKFSELDSERKQYKAEMDNVNKYVNKFAEVSKNDKVDGLIELAKAVGIDPLDYKRQLRGELLNKYSEYLSMDENERANYEQQEELQYLKSQRAAEVEQKQSQQAQEELYNRYVQVQNTYDMDDERMGSLADDLEKVYNVEVSPENIANLHQSYVRLDRVESALGKINPEYVEDDEKVLQLESLLVGNSNLTDEQLVATATKLWGNDVEKAVVELEKKAPVVTAQPKKHDYQPKLQRNGNNLNFFE